MTKEAVGKGERVRDGSLVDVLQSCCSNPQRSLSVSALYDHTSGHRGCRMARKVVEGR